MTYRPGSLDTLVAEAKRRAASTHTPTDTPYGPDPVAAERIDLLREDLFHASNARDAAAAERDRLEQQVAAVRALHTLHLGGTGGACDHCYRGWPCPTVRLLDGES